MPPKRTSSGSPIEGPSSKHVKIEHPEEFSNAVKKRLQSSTRTGQACDRCKVRKIRCDGLQGGCSPCLQNNTECRTTDRITGRATSRGYTENLEQQTRDMAQRIQELEQQLMRHGGEVKSSNGFHNGGATGYDYNHTSSNMQTQSWSPSTTYPTPPNHSIATQHQETNVFRGLPAFRTGCMGDNYLGVSPGNSNLSSIKGTALSILGMEIDIADFTSADMDEPESSSIHQKLYNKSYQAFLQSALNINPRITKVELPIRTEGFTYADWYFRVLHPYMPLLHRPTFMKLLTRLYDDPTFRPTTAETVIVHMVFAIMFFQYATRNWNDRSMQDDLNKRSNEHYHYSLGMFYSLSCSHTLQDVQALTLICAHLRNFPKPGASWMLTQTTLSLAIELGLHRSASRWAPDIIPNALDVELRKRTFWSLLAIHVTLAGKLGRPMAFRWEDFDVELPEAMDDELLSENGLDTSTSGRCSHKIGLQAFRIVPLFLELYNTLYAVRRQPDQYITTVNHLEARIREWKEGLPAEFTNANSTSNDQETRVFQLYAQVWSLEFRLLLRHPSVSMTTDAAFNAESMRVCIETSRQMLAVVRQLQRFKSLDTTWYNSAVYVMAITTTLFAQWEKRGEISAADLAALRDEMDLWLDIMNDVGALLGSGTRLKEAVRVVTDGTLGLLNRSLPNKTTNYVTSSSQEEIKPPPPPAVSSSSPYTSAPQAYPYDNSATSNNNTPTSNYLPGENQMGHQSTPYPAATQYPGYSDPTPSQSTIAYTPQDAQTYNSYQVSSTEGVEAPLLAAFAAQTTSQANNWQRQSPHQHTYSGSHSWQQYTNTLSGSIEPQVSYSATALMELGGRDMSDGHNANSNISHSGTSLGEMAGGQTVNMDQSQLGGHLAGGMAWPLNIFDIGQAGPGS